MRTCYAIARSGVSGGTGTLSLRLIRELHQKGYYCAYLCCENNAADTMKQMEAVADEVVCCFDSSYKKQFESIKNRYEQFVILTYSVDEYLSIDKLRIFYPQIKRVILYVVHGYAFSLPNLKNMSKHKRCIKLLALRIMKRPLVKALLRKNSIIFMDEISIQTTSKTLSLKIDNSVIHHLPIKVKEYSADTWIKLKRHEPFTIGTMCRMEFPMKGYVVGLVDEFPALLKKFDVSLNIVGDGDGGEYLRGKIASLPDNIRNRVKYTKIIPYDQIGSFYSECDLFLGMGTTLLDAANYNVLAAPVFSYRMDLKIASLFVEDVDWICERGEMRDLDDLLNSLRNLTRERYNLLIKEQYEKVRDAYGMEQFLSILLESEIGCQTCPKLIKNIYVIFQKIHNIITSRP